MSEHDHSSDRPGLLAVVRSVGAALLGVQSQANRERDFTRGNPIHFILVGAAATGVLVLSIWGLVQVIVATAG